MKPDQHYLTPAQAVPVRPWEPKRLAAPEDLARLLQPVRRRRAVLPAVLLGRRGGRTR